MAWINLQSWMSRSTVGSNIRAWKAGGLWRHEFAIYGYINWQSISIYGYFVTSLIAYYSCADINESRLIVGLIAKRMLLKSITCPRHRPIISRILMFRLSPIIFKLIIATLLIPQKTSNFVLILMIWLHSYYLSSISAWWADIQWWSEAGSWFVRLYIQWWSKAGSWFVRNTSRCGHVTVSKCEAQEGEPLHE